MPTPPGRGGLAALVGLACARPFFSARAFLPERDLFPESLAHDARTGSFASAACTR